MRTFFFCDAKTVKPALRSKYTDTQRRASTRDVEKEHQNDKDLGKDGTHGAFFSFTMFHKKKAEIRKGKKCERVSDECPRGRVRQKESYSSEVWVGNSLSSCSPSSSPI